jgi:hypothetical protein
MEIYFRGSICSRVLGNWYNDLVCVQHEPENHAEDRFLHGAACHGCLLIAETSCEPGGVTTRPKPIVSKD